MADLSTAGHPDIPDAAAQSPAAPLRRRRARNLAHELVDGIAGQIRARELKPGDKLPTESAIMLAWGVSRTVVREALSRLQAAGLVQTRHGVGTFVLDPPAHAVFRIQPAELATAVDVLAMLELRISLETESAGLAAMRRTAAQLEEMRAALDAFEANVPTEAQAPAVQEMPEGEGATISPDFRFHLAIAHATGNRYFAEIMQHMGAAIIPRSRIDSSKFAVEERAQYLRRVNREHEEIYAAIARQDAESARAAMRIHLTNSRERLRLAQEAASRQLGVAL